MSDGQLLDLIVLAMGIHALGFFALVVDVRPSDLREFVAVPAFDASARGALRRMPPHWRQAVNRASLPILGVPQLACRLLFTPECEADLGRKTVEFEALQDAAESFKHLERAAFGATEAWQAWAEACERLDFQLTRDPYTEHARDLIVWLVYRPKVVLHWQPGRRPIVRERFAAWVVRRYGL